MNRDTFDKSRLSALAKLSQPHDWEPVTDDDIHRVLSIWPEDVPMPCERLRYRKESTIATAECSIQCPDGVIELLCTIPELASILNRQVTSAQRAYDLSADVYDEKLSTTIVYTVIRGLSDITAIYSPEAFLILQTFLNSITVHAGKHNDVDSVLVADVLDFLLSEGRDENGIPDSFIPIAKPVITLLSSVAVNDPSIESRLRKSLKQIIQGRITCADLRERARQAEADLKRPT